MEINPTGKIGCGAGFWSAAFQRRFLSFAGSRRSRKESGVETPHSKTPAGSRRPRKESGVETPHSKTPVICGVA
jgi:hypothetical protein